MLNLYFLQSLVKEYTVWEVYTTENWNYFKKTRIIKPRTEKCQMNVDNSNQLRLESVDQVWCFLQYTNGQHLPGSDSTPSLHY